MRTVLRIAGGSLAGLTIALAAAPLANAQSTTQPAPNAAIFLKPSKGLPGSGFTISWSGFSRPDLACRNIEFTWDGTPLPTATLGRPPSGSTSATVPNGAKPGAHTVKGEITIGNCKGLSAVAIFTVEGPSNPPSDPPSSPPSNPPVTNPPVTNPPVTNPPVTRPPVTRPPVTTTTPPTTTTTPPTTTTEPPPSTTDTPTSTTPTGGELVLDKPAINPGDPLSATGRGCDANAPVTLISDGERVGGAVSEADGTFRAPVEFTKIRAGRHQVTASCGVVLTGAVDQIVTSSTSGHSSTMIVLVFFVLAGVAVLRFN
jgi:hypothetical protein